MVRQATNYNVKNSPVKRPNFSNMRNRQLMDVDPIFDPRLVYEDIPDFLGLNSPPKRPPMVIRRTPPSPVKRQDQFRQTIYKNDMDASSAFSKLVMINPKPSENNKVMVKKEKEPLECPRPGCGKKFVWQKVLDKHLLNHDVVKKKKEPFTCPHCQKTITTSYRLKLHIRLHTGEKPYSCEFCEIAFSDPKHHKDHMKQHEGQILYKPRVPIDQREFNPEAVKSEFKAPADLFKFKCKRRGCGKKFLHQSAFTMHMRLHTGEKPFPCTECPLRFRAPHILRAHMRIHTGERPYQCDQCPEDFKRMDVLRVHLRNQHGIVVPSQKSNVLDPSQVSLNNDVEPPKAPSAPKKSYLKMFSCPHEGCDKKFTHTFLLEKHAKIHSGEKPHTCEVCKKGYADGYSLKLHMRLHTGEKPYKCNKCSEMFTRSDKLRNHLKKHVGEKTVSCGICGESFETNQEKSDHVLEKHMPEKLRIARQANLAQAAAEEAQREAERAEKEAVEAERLAEEQRGPSFQWS